MAHLKNKNKKTQTQTKGKPQKLPRQVHGVKVFGYKLLYK